MTAFILKHKNHFWLLVAILVAFGLRVHALGAQSLWNDEGTSVALSALSLEAITNGAARDIHPPLYYYLLHFWLPITGNTEYAIRFMSVIAGVVTVAFVFRIAYSAFDVEIAILAAYLAAFSPFQVYYSQEARMYIWVTLWSAASVWAMLMIQRGAMSEGRKEGDHSSPRAFRNSRVQDSLLWLAYIAATTAALYTQYIGAFVVVAENLAFAIWFFFALRTTHYAIRNTQYVLRTLGIWLGAQLIIGALFLPWYLFAGGQLASWPSISEPLDLPTLLWRALNVFSVGLTLDPAVAAPIALAYGALFLLGWRRAPNVTANWVIITLILWTLVPVAVMYIVSLARPAYNPKFLLLATPAFYILSARGLAQIHPGVFLRARHRQTASPFRFVFLALAVLAVVGLVPALQNLYTEPRYARDDYRAVVQEIDAHARAGDSVLVDAPGQMDVVRYYHRGNQSLYLLPRMRPPDGAATRADVDAMLAQSRRVFAIYYATEQSDPQNIIGERMAQRAFLARAEWHGNLRLALYGVAPDVRGAAQPLAATFGEAITLTSYQLDQRQARIGDVLTLTLNWRAAQTPGARYKVFAHLLDAHDQVVAQRDGEPGGDLRITTTWRAGETIADNYGIWLAPGLAPGAYRLAIGMYRAEDGARLRVGESDQLVLGTVHVE